MSLLTCERKFTIVMRGDVLFAALLKVYNMITLFLCQEAVAIRQKIYSYYVKIATT